MSPGCGRVCREVRALTVCEAGGFVVRGTLIPGAGSSPKKERKKEERAQARGLRSGETCQKVWQPCTPAAQIKGGLGGKVPDQCQGCWPCQWGDPSGGEGREYARR